MLAGPEPSAQSIWARHEESRSPSPSVWVEDKFDGVRAQLHRSGARVEIFSRDLRRVTAQFDEIAHAARALPVDVIFDGEIVAFAEGRRLTFFDLQKRLGRRAPDLFLGDAIPIFYLIFDLLFLNGRPLLGQPLRERRRLLESLDLPSAHMRLAAVTQADSADAIDAAFAQARARGNEGLIVKDPASLYTPGRRGLSWLKLKKELATLDVAVVGVEWGHGKRNAVLSDYTFAVRDEETGELRTIGKAYSGLTDQEILELTPHFQQTTLAILGKYHEVNPEIVLEVAFDSIQPSTRHNSGLSMRFPRIKAIRRD
jgi:DNA ligase-1